MCKLGIVDQLMDGFMFYSVKIISTLCLLLTYFYNISMCFYDLAREQNELAQAF